MEEGRKHIFWGESPFTPDWESCVSSSLSIQVHAVKLRKLEQLELIILESILLKNMHRRLCENENLFFYLKVMLTKLPSVTLVK